MARALDQHQRSALGNEFIGLEPIGPALWQVYFGPTTLGWFDEELFVIFDTHGNTGRNPIPSLPTYVRHGARKELE